ncbi:MAG: hypothetical protein HZC55_02860 [Verrucomicrobia bacterium]|nr:hypothetical protein [Verrucomicrobiota bacterium]
MGLGLPLDPSLYLPSGARYQGTATQSAIVGVGLDPITGVSTTYNGSYAARVNNSINDYTVNVISQKVLNYSGSTINFEWSAVLEDSHGLNDSDHFSITLTDNTTNSLLYNVAISSASFPGYFSQVGVWNYSGWQVQTIAVTSGHDYTLTLLAADCPYGGHAGYVYLDGFADVIVPQGVPDRGMVAAMLLSACAGLLAFRRRV